MSVINHYGPVVQQYGSPEQLAQQDPRLLNQIITELGQSGEAQDQAAYEQLKEYYSPSVGGGAFIVHQDMKDAMTRQQQAYAQPVQPQPTGNPVYNAAVAAAKKSEPVITQAAVPDASTGEPKVIVMKPSSYWDTGAVTPESPMTMGKPEVIRESGVKLEPPTGYQIVPGSIKTSDSNIEYQVQSTPEPVKQSDLSIASQLNIAYQTGLKLFSALADKNLPKDSVVNKLAKAEIEYGIAPVLGAHAGGTATLESTVYGIASLPGSAVKSVKEGKLTYASGFEGFDENIKTPRLAPTVTSSVINAALGSHRELEEIEKMPAGYKLGYTTGSALTEAGLMAVESVGVGRVVSVVKGVKVTRLTGAKEVERLVGTGTSLKATRVTQPIVQTQRVSSKTASKIAEFKRYVTPENLLMGGKQVKVEHYADDTVRVVSGATQASREASPFVETVSRQVATQPSIAQKVLQTLRVVKPTAKTTSMSMKEYASEGIGFSSKTLGVAEKGKSLIYSTQTVKAPQAVFPYGEAVAKKTFTSAMIEGSIDPQVYLKLTKAVGPEVAQKWYPQMGGVSAQVIQRTMPKSVRVVSDVIAVSTPKTTSAVGTIGALNVGSEIVVASQAGAVDRKTESIPVRTEYSQFKQPEKIGNTPIFNIPPSDEPRNKPFESFSEPVIVSPTDADFKPAIVSVVVPDVTPSYMPSTDDIEIPIESIIEIPRQDEPTKPIDDTPQKPVYEPPPPIIIDVGISGLGFPSGFKFEGGGYSLPSHSRSVGMRSTLKVHPILTGLEALTGGRKREKRVSKTKKTKKR